MDRFFDHCQRYFPLPDEAIAFLAVHGEVRHYRKGELFMRPDERMPYWCMVLEGLVCGYTLDQTGRRQIHWFAMPMQGFAGVRHLYTPSKSGHYIQYLQDSITLRIPALRMREAKERFPQISELLHILKQQYIDRQDRLVEVLQQPTAYGRYVAFRANFPEIARRVNADVQREFINVRRSKLFEARKRWLKGGRR